MFLSFLKRSIIKGETHRASVYWMFDPNIDRVKVDDIKVKDNTNQQDLVKAMVSELYNKVVEDIYFEMIDQIDLRSILRPQSVADLRSDSPILTSSIATSSDAAAAAITTGEITETDTTAGSIMVKNALKVVNFLEESILGIPLSQDMYEDIERYIFEKKMINLPNGDLLGNDTLYGLEGKTIRAPS